MAKDEELLLGNMEKGSASDSDEVVEEFKLPPKRSRKKRYYNNELFWNNFRIILGC